MTKVKLFKTNDTYTKIVVDGHSGYGTEGEDIVCAGISALVINFVNSVEEFTDDKYNLKTDDGLIDFVFVNTPSSDSSLLFNSLILGLENLSNDYSEFLSILIEEE